MARRTLPCLTMMVGLLVVAVAPAYGSHSYQAQGASLRTFHELIVIYHHDLGKHLVTDEHDTWFEKLDAHFDHIDLTQMRFGTTSDGRHPVDMFGHRLIYEPPSPATGNQIVLRSVGRNGIDEQGAGDDWDIRYGPNFGYWHTENWPAAYRRAVICVGLALIGCVVVWRKVKPGLWRLALIATWSGLLATVVLPMGFDRGPWGSTSASIDPPWLTSVGVLGVLVLILSVPIYIRAVVSSNHRRVRDRDYPEGRCARCGYDRRGLRSRGIVHCPECGSPW